MALTDQTRETYERLFKKPAGNEGKPHEEFMDILQNEIFGEVFSIGVLSDAERELLTVAALATMQTLPQLNAHVKAALNTGITPEAIQEAIYMLAPAIGYPKTLNAIAVMDQVFAERGIQNLNDHQGVVTQESREELGRSIQVPLYGDEVKDVFASLPEPYGKLVPHLLSSVMFGDFETRKVLSVAERELVVLTSLCALGASQQMAPHIAGAVKAGNSVETVTAAIVQILPYVGFPRALSALSQIVSYIRNGAKEAYR